MRNKSQLIAVLTIAVAMSACTSATVITIEKKPDGSEIRTIETPAKMKKETKKALGIVIAGVAMKAIDKNIFPYLELATKFMIAEKKIENGVVEPAI